MQQRYRSIEAVFRESFEHMENEAPGFERRSVRLDFWGVLWKVQQESVFNDVSVFFIGV